MQRQQNVLEFEGQVLIEETVLISDYDFTKIWMRDRTISKVFGRFDNFYDFLCSDKIGQIYNVKYLRFHLTPSLPSFMKIDATYKNGTEQCALPPPPLSVTKWSQGGGLEI